MANMFNEDGTYNKTDWKSGDKITAVKLNKIELSLEAINNNDIDRHVEADSRLDDLEGVNADSRLDALESITSNMKKINALDLNVKNDGSDTTMELQSAIDYCRERRYQLYIPSGTYFIRDTIVIGNYSKIIGDGKEYTTIKTDREIDMFILNTSTENGSYGIEISNIKLNGGKTANTGFYLFSTRESTLCDVQVTDCKCGIKLNQAWSNSIISSRIIYNDINLLLGDQTNDLNLIDNCFDNALENAIHITGDSQVINLTGCVIQNSVGNGILLDAGRSVNINSCYFENNNKNENANSYDVNIRGEKQRVQSVSISGCGFWCKKVSGAIFIDKGNNITITGGYVLPMVNDFDGYAVDASSNARDVYIFNLYKELVSNNGEIFDISKPTFKSNISISKDYPTLTINTTTEHHDPIVSFSTNDETTAMLTTYGDTFRILSRNHTTRDMEEIFSIHDDNLYARFHKNILLLNGSGITGANDINSKIYYFTDVAGSQVSNNSIFVDESDGILKYKDNNGKIFDISSSTFKSNISISKDYPTLTINTTTEHHDPIVSFSTNGESTAILTTYGDIFKILSRNHTTGDMEEIFSIHDNNLYARFHKNILLLNGSGITGANDVSSKIYYFTDVARSQVSNNSIFVDESDGVLKYKDKNGVVKKISLE